MFHLPFFFKRLGNAFILFPITLTYNIVPYPKKGCCSLFFLEGLGSLGSSWILLDLGLSENRVPFHLHWWINAHHHYPVLSHIIIPYYPILSPSKNSHLEGYTVYTVHYSQTQPFGHQDGFPCQGLYTFDAGCHGRPVGSRCCSRGSGGSHRRAQRAAWRMRFRFFVGKAVGEIVGQ